MHILTGIMCHLKSKKLKKTKQNKTKQKNTKLLQPEKRYQNGM